MKFQEIKENAKVFPGEYLLHQPSQQIVMCGAYKKSEGLIKALKNGQLMEDKVENFRGSCRGNHKFLFSSTGISKDARNKT